MQSAPSISYGESHRARNFFPLGESSWLRSKLCRVPICVSTLAPVLLCRILMCRATSDSMIAPCSSLCFAPREKNVLTPWRKPTFELSPLPSAVKDDVTPARYARQRLVCTRCMGKWTGSHCSILMYLHLRIIYVTHVSPPLITVVSYCRHLRS